MDLMGPEYCSHLGGSCVLPGHGQRRLVGRSQVKTDDDEAFAMCRSLVRGWVAASKPQRHDTTETVQICTVCVCNVCMPVLHFLAPY